MSDNYIWVDNPTVSQVSTYNPDVLNDCLMHLKYDNIPSNTKLFSFNSGNVDSNGDADLIDASFSSESEVNLKYSTPGKYSINIPFDSYCHIVLVGGGGYSKSEINSYGYISNASGGSGACFVGEVFLTAGNHIITVGNCAENSSIDNLIIAGAGENGYLDPISINLQGSGGAGGLVSVSGSVQNVQIQQNGNKGGFSNGGVTQAGGDSVYFGYGKGASSSATNNTSGYAEIICHSLENQNSNIINYKIGIEYPPLIGTLPSGEQITISGLDSDDVSSLVDGTYNKFVGINGVSELLNNKIYRQSNEPSPNINDVWFDISSEPVSVSKWDGSNWIQYDNIPLGKITVLNGVVSDYKTFSYSCCDVSSPNSLYPDVIIKEYINDASGSWYRIYASGYVEQGGFLEIQDSTDTTVNFLVPMSTFLNCFFSCTKGSGQDQYAYQIGFNGNYIVDNKQMGMIIRAVSNSTVAAWWKVMGRMA